MNVRLIKKLEQTTPACPVCRSSTRFVMGAAYELLECTGCGQTTPAPTSLTRTIVAAYNIPAKNTDQKRIQPCILGA
jgi:hypothetical protein